MNAAWQLWLQLFRRTPLLVVLANLLRAAALYFAVRWLLGSDEFLVVAASLYGVATWMWHTGQGYNLRGVCTAESFLLPNFRRRLLEYAAIDLAMWVLLPLVVAAVGRVPHLLLVGGGLLLIAATGLMMGSNPRSSAFIWPIFVVLGWMPSFMADLLKDALHSPFTPWLLLAIVALLLRFSVAPLLRIVDREADASPLESTSLGRMQTRGAPGEPRRMGAFGKRITALYEQLAERAMRRALTTYRRNPSFQQRMILVRRLLLPNDNPEAIGLRIVLVSAIVCFYFVAIMHRQHFNPVVIGAYAIMLSISRFPQLNVGMTRMRPNMADLYLTLAPETRTEYQQTISDALLVLVPISLLTALVYTALGAWLVHVPDPLRMLFVATIVSLAASLAALALHLIGPEGTTGRTIVNLVVLFGTMAVYWGGYWLVGALGYGWGGGLLALLALGFGAGVWFAAQREYVSRSPRFDAPIT
ncbi:hypothetical protein [Dyella flagellata]|uniref:Uncharacterized protein n=1 Tax=Dyella flagellata TaxID=1867833 RepID=A0ABQ5XBQ6_9GAMM|nr:hypothetical protein [Dyella flagellata]GLQ89125.1 hypothetical protein GCM10007898_26970 [Dyella flagellata]